MSLLFQGRIVDVAGLDGLFSPLQLDEAYLNRTNLVQFCHSFLLTVLAQRSMASSAPDPAFNLFRDAAEALKSEDKKMDLTFRRAHQASAWAIKAAFFARTSLLWLRQLQASISPEEERTHQNLRRSKSLVYDEEIGTDHDFHWNWLLPN